MIAFVSLFLGLVVGVQPVEINVAENVAAVEIVLDGETVGQLIQAPWKLDVDFGEAMPHELVAIARDAEGQELERIHQWINRPPPRAALEVALGAPRRDGRRKVSLHWESTTGAKPRVVRVTFDGREVVTEERAVESGYEVLLPKHDLQQLHFLRAEVEFSAQVSAVEEVTFGGVFVDQISNEMTALVVRSGKKKLSADDLQGLLLKNGEPLTVTAVERGTAKLVVVTDKGYFGEDLKAFMTEADRLYPPYLKFRQRRGNLQGAVRDQGLRTSDMDKLWSLSRGDSFQLLWPVPEAQTAGSRVYELYPSSPPFAADELGLMYLLSNFDTSLLPDRRQNLTAAVAAAGLKAARDSQRRAVLLQLSSRPRSAGQLAPATARRYLEALQVPFYVFAPAAGQDPGWGEVATVTLPNELTSAFKEVREDLDQQWVVWVVGFHLPHQITLSSNAQDLTLVGSPDA